MTMRRFHMGREEGSSQNVNIRDDTKSINDGDKVDKVNNSNSVKKNTSTGKRKFVFSFSFRIRSKTYLKPLLA